MEITPKLSHHNKKFGLMFIFMLLKCEIYHNTTDQYLKECVNPRKHVQEFRFIFLFVSLCKYSLDIIYVNVQNLLPKRNLQKCALLPLYPVPLFFRMPANGTNQCFQRRI